MAGAGQAVEQLERLNHRTCASCSWSLSSRSLAFLLFSRAATWVGGGCKGTRMAVRGWVGGGCNRGPPVVQRGPGPGIAQRSTKTSANATRHCVPVSFASLLHVTTATANHGPPTTAHLGIGFLVLLLLGAHVAVNQVLRARRLQVSRLECQPFNQQTTRGGLCLKLTSSVHVPAPPAAHP